MAVKYNNAVRTARMLLGTPYSEMDCIRLIVMIIRRTPGGDTAYRCEGTNWLWKSALNAKKYRHLSWRQEGLTGARAGMLAFKRTGEDVHHVGYVTREGTVIHSSSVNGMVMETPLDSSWDLLAVHKDLLMDEETEREEEPEDVAPEATKDDRYTSLVREDGVSIMLAGAWRVAED